MSTKPMKISVVKSDSSHPLHIIALQRYCAATVSLKVWAMKLNILERQIDRLSIAATWR